MSTTVSRHTHTDTRKLILRVARELLLTRSYLGLSFQDVADRVGIRKASLYHHFASKEVLGVALLAESLDRFKQWTESVSGLAAADQALAYVRMFRDSIGAKQRVCPVGALGGEWDCIEPALQQAARQLHGAHLDWLTGVARRLRNPSSVPSSDDSARHWAAHVTAVCQGALINARVHGDITMFDITVAPLRTSLLTSP